jgi:hypothetical protein
MAPWLQRLLTVMAGAGVVVAGVLIPGAQAILIPLGVGLAATSVPHPADKTPG